MSDVPGGFTTTLVDGVGNPIHDPLTCSDWWVHEDRVCSCGAPEEALHAEDCNVSAIYAEMVWRYAEDGDAPSLCIRDIANAMAMRERHLFACALCGAVAYAEDMTPIYQAPLYNDDPGRPDYAYKYPKNIVKVVCNKHNRVSKAPAFQQVPASGY